MIKAGQMLEHVLVDVADILSTATSVVEEDDLQWWAFPETWSSTALGMGGMGGQAITTAQTIIVVDFSRNVGFVYRGGRFYRRVHVRDAVAMAAACRSRP